MHKFEDRLRAYKSLVNASQRPSIADDQCGVKASSRSELHCIVMIRNTLPVTDPMAAGHRPLRTANFAERPQAKVKEVEVKMRLCIPRCS